MKTAPWIVVIALAFAAVVPAAAVPAPRVARMDTGRFAGTWYQLARLDSGAQNGVQSDCASDVTAHYELRPDGKLQVTNSCRTPTGRLATDIGVACMQATDARHAAHWKVSFLPEWLQWLPVGQADLWVVMLDPGYRFAVISDASRRNLWLLSRSPTLPAEELGRIVDHLAAEGYPTSQLVLTHQSAVLRSIEADPAESAAGRSRLMVRNPTASDAA